MNMNVVGKVLTVLILVMALSFMAFSLMVYAVCPDWRTQVIGKGGLNDQWQAAKAEKAQLDKDKKQLEDRLLEETDRYVKRLAALEREKNDLLKEREANQEKLDIKEDALSDIARKISTIHNSVKAIFADAAAVRGETKAIIEQRRKAFEQAVRTIDDLLNSVTERLRLAKLGRELQSQLAKMLPATNPVALPNQN